MNTNSAEKSITSDNPVVDLAVETLSGDVRDVILGIVRDMPCWPKLGQWDQQRFIDRAATAGRSLVRRAALLIAKREFPSLSVAVVKWTVKEGALKIELGGAATEKSVGALIGEGSAAVLVLCDVEEFMGERAPAVAEKDQPDLPLAEGSEKPADSLSPEQAQSAFEATAHKAPTPSEADALLEEQRRRRAEREDAQKKDAAKTADKYIKKPRRKGAKNPPIDAPAPEPENQAAEFDAADAAAHDEDIERVYATA